jgi:hypothetical protein
LGENDLDGLDGALIVERLGAGLLNKKEAEQGEKVSGHGYGLVLMMYRTTVGVCSFAKEGFYPVRL